ncbi:YlxM family DNA-binding protein [Thermohalobacter berrensis]|uniref:UPF0122 protein BET03_00820 n=1 Tax=Thermohalobacter berrensis TaxID=99594 RepID=A0A419TAC9_9FIRM|nr:sigma factor-like helix-turn-helix DNA-binding protein [Thermohalobacter berrensis]RKD34407.1 DNA-binding protein [Thermohalobacter berrensis]
MYEKVVEIGLLFDFYGKLLSERQYIIIEMYYLHDLSLAEIGEQLKISRQGVYDILKRAEDKLYSYEDKLGLVKKFQDNKKKLKKILDYANKVNEELTAEQNGELKNHIKEIKEIALDILEKN